MAFSSIQGHSEIIERLMTAWRNNRIPSAYLCVGQNGVGRTTALREFARVINCEDETCQGTCPSCRMFQEKRHPDFYVIKPSGQGIRISQIHELAEHLSLKPAYAKKRVVIVKEAHKLNTESANSFLKLLEEPPLNTLIVLIAPDEQLLLETIVSRCQKLAFAPLKSSELKEIYTESFSVKPDELTFLLSYSQGRIRKEFQKKLAALIPMRDQVIQMIRGLEDEQMAEYFNWLDRWIKNDLFSYFLEFSQTLFRDLVNVKVGVPDLALNQDRLTDLKDLSTRFTSESLRWCFDIIVETESAIKANASRQLALESLLIQLKQIKAGNFVV